MRKKTSNNKSKQITPKTKTKNQFVQISNVDQYFSSKVSIKQNNFHLSLHQLEKKLKQCL
ncbi:hypothetical protein DERF_001422 [Dermatophagoides farinae]|uniref:Uncharacterized protein n=1 Tax=Dermatophagoides farinae TaxID=6954 RepID=A0A922IAH1_DERFA|nr:hypothetical protein DERF_001422 [Dermatophagoides farinae]